MTEATLQQNSASSGVGSSPNTAKSQNSKRLEPVSTKQLDGGATFNHYKIPKQHPTYQFTNFTEKDMKSLYGTNGTGQISRRNLMKKKRREQVRERTKEEEQKKKPTSNRAPKTQKMSAAAAAAKYRLAGVVVPLVPQHHHQSSPYPPQPQHTSYGGLASYSMNGSSSESNSSSFSPAAAPQQGHKGWHEHKNRMRKRSYDDTFRQEYYLSYQQHYHSVSSAGGPPSYSPSMPPQHSSHEHTSHNGWQRSKSVPTLDENHVEHFKMRPNPDIYDPSPNANNQAASTGGASSKRSNHERSDSSHSSTSSNNDTTSPYPQKGYDRRLRRRLSLTEECQPSDEENSPRFYSGRRYSSDSRFAGSVQKEIPNPFNFPSVNGIYRGRPVYHAAQLGRRSSMPNAHALTDHTTGFTHQIDDENNGLHAPPVSGAHRRSSVSSLIGPGLQAVSLNGHPDSRSHEEWFQKFKRPEKSAEAETLQNELANFKFGSSGSPEKQEPDSGVVEINLNDEDSDLVSPRTADTMQSESDFGEPEQGGRSSPPMLPQRRRCSAPSQQENLPQLSSVPDEPRHNGDMPRLPGFKELLSAASLR